MARKDVVEPLFLDHPQRFLQSVEKVHRRGAVPISLRGFTEQPPPIPIDPRQLGFGAGRHGAGADAGKGHAGRQHQPLL